MSRYFGGHFYVMQERNTLKDREKSMTSRVSLFDSPIIPFLVVSHDSIRGCVRPSVGWSVRNAFVGGQRQDSEQRMVVYTNLFLHVYSSLRAYVIRQSIFFNRYKYQGPLPKALVIGVEEILCWERRRRLEPEFYVRSFLSSTDFCVQSRNHF